MKVFAYFLLVITKNVLGVPYNRLYPFGQRLGDALGPNVDDGSTSAIHLSTRFPYFNHSYGSIFVNTNGDLTFGNALRSYTPEPFPHHGHIKIIATYWGDVDTGNGGNILYRETHDSSLLQRASTDIQSTFPEQGSFHASWMFITTWNNVAFYGADSQGSRRRCTFQCVLVTDGIYSFVMYLYNKIQWTTGTSNDGDSSTGLGGTPAQVGFDSGDGTHYYVVPGSRTSDIIHMPQKSNIGVPGKFIFRVDMAAIQRATTVDECEGVVCYHNEPCEDLDGLSRWRCNCLPGFTGQLCDIEINECDSSPCQHGGRCLDLLDAYTCHCKDGYTGGNCEIDINECLNNPCLHGATCRDLENHYSCDCQAGYQGNNCQIDIDECISDPCYNNATCVDKTPGWYCGCLPGYSGNQCQIEINECQSFPCQHNGTCTDLVNGFICTCTNETLGNYCEKWIDHCSSAPCLHGGTCKNHYGGYTCDCPEPWHGTQCEYREHERPENCTDLEYTECSCFTHQLKPKKKKIPIIGGAIGFSVGLLLTGAFYAMWSFLNSFGNGSDKFKPDNLVHPKEKSSEPLTKALPKRIINKQPEEPEHHNCFIDHNGFDFSKRILNKDGRLPKCRHMKS